MKSKRKIGSFTKHCINIGYTGSKDGRCHGKKDMGRETSNGYKIPLDYDKDLFYDKVEKKKTRKHINESTYGDKINKTIKEFVANQKVVFKLELDECMFDLLDEYESKSGFNSRYYEYMSGIKKGEICVFFTIIVPVEFKEKDLVDNMTSCINRLSNIGTSFNILVSYHSNYKYITDDGTVISGGTAMPYPMVEFRCDNKMELSDISKFSFKLVQEIEDQKRDRVTEISFHIW